MDTKINHAIINRSIILGDKKVGIMVTVGLVIIWLQNIVQRLV